MSLKKNRNVLDKNVLQSNFVDSTSVLRKSNLHMYFMFFIYLNKAAGSYSDFATYFLSGTCT